MLHRSPYPGFDPPRRTHPPAPPLPTSLATCLPQPVQSSTERSSLYTRPLPTPPVPEHSQSQQTGKVPFWYARSWCRLTSSQGLRGAQSPPWCVLKSLGHRSCFLAHEFEVAARPAVCPAVWPGRGPPGKGGNESPRLAEAGGAGGGRARWLPPRKPPLPCGQRRYGSCTYPHLQVVRQLQVPGARIETLNFSKKKKNAKALRSTPNRANHFLHLILAKKPRSE